MMPNLLVFAPHCLPPSGAEAIVTSKLLLTLRKAGWSLRVISRRDALMTYPDQPSGIWEPLFDCVKLIPDQASVSTDTKGISRGRLSSLHWVFSTFRHGAQLLKNNRFDAMVSRIMPQYGHLPALWLSYLYKVPWIACWSDPHPLSKAPPPYGGGIAGRTRSLELNYARIVCRRAAWNIFPCERLRTYMMQYLPIRQEKSSVIPHPALTELFSKNLEPVSRFSLCIAGGLDMRRIDVFLDGVKRFLAGNVDAQHHMELWFVGRHGKELEKYLQNNDLISLAKLYPPLDYLTVDQMMRQSAVLVLVEADTPEGIFLPAKLVDYAQTGRPIFAVGPRQGTVRDMLEANGGGISSDVKSVESVSQGLESLYRAWLKKTLEIDFGSTTLRAIFDEKNIIGGYQKILSDLEI